MQPLQLGSIVLCVALVSGSVFALESAVPRQHHEWGRFNEGAWKRVQVVSQTVDGSGALVRRTTTETISTLVEVSDRGYAVKVETVVNVAGRQFATPPKIIRRGFCGQPEGQTGVVRRIGTESVNIRGQEIPSEVRRMVVQGQGAQQVVTVHYSDRVSPHVLQREATVMDPSSKTARHTTQTKTIALDEPRKVLAEIKPTSQVRTVHRSPQGTAVTVEVHCTDIPGSVVEHVTKEFNSDGRLIRTNTLRLLAYGTVENDVTKSSTRRRRFFRRGRR